MNHNGNATEITLPEKVFWYVENGRSYGQTAEVLNMPKATVYKVYQKERKRRETVTKTTGNEVETTANEQTENANAVPEKPFTPVSEPFTSVSFWREFAQSFHPADLVFYAVVAIGCAGVSGALPGIGIAVASVWFAVSALYLHRVKMYARWFDIALLAIFEVCAGFVADWVWANNALWENISRLPFRVYVEKYENGAGELVAFYAGKDVEMPAYIACYIAAMLVVFGGAAVAVSTLAVQNQSRKP